MDLERAKRASKQAAVELKRLESSDAPNAEKLRKVSANSQKLIANEKRLETRLHMMTIGLVYSGFAEMSKRKQETIRSLVGMVAHSSKAIYAKRAKIWGDLLGSLTKYLTDE